MKGRSELFPEFKCESLPPPIPPEVGEEIAMLKADGASVIKQVLEFMDELKRRGYNKTQSVQMAMHFFPRAKSPRQVRGAKSVALEVKKIGKVSEVEKCLVRMERGKDYGIADIEALLPPESRLRAIEKDRARKTAIGVCLTRLAAEGMLMKIEGRNACYSLPEAPPSSAASS